MCSLSVVELAFIDSDRAWEYREKLFEKIDKINDRKFGYVCSNLAKSLVGLNSYRAWDMRKRLLGIGCDVDSILESLANLDSERAWGMREDLYNKHGTSVEFGNFFKSMIGLDSDRAWKMRDMIWENSGGGGYYPVEYLAGIDSDRAWKIRDDILGILYSADVLEVDKSIIRSLVSKSLCGLDTERAWEVRERDDFGCDEILHSLTGVNSERAWNMRKQCANVLCGGSYDFPSVVWRAPTTNEDCYIWLMALEHN